MLSIPYEKHCSKCDLVKPLTEFYPRGKGSKHYCSYCKACMKLDSKKQRKGDRKISYNESEQAVISRLATLGIAALPGKALSHQWADIIIWGCVLAETKSSAFRNGQFTFAFTHDQRRNGVRGSLIILVCRYEHRNTYHVFPASYPGFYGKDGRLKTMATWTPNRSNSGRPPIFTDEIMSSHQDAWHMIEAERQRISQQLRDGRELVDVMLAA